MLDFNFGLARKFDIHLIQRSQNPRTGIASHIWKNIQNCKYNLRIRLWSFDKSEYGQVDYEEITVASAAEDYELFLYGYFSDYSWRALVTIITI